MLVLGSGSGTMVFCFHKNSYKGSLQGCCVWRQRRMMWCRWCWCCPCHAERENGSRECASVLHLSAHAETQSHRPAVQPRHHPEGGVLHCHRQKDGTNPTQSETFEEGLDCFNLYLLGCTLSKLQAAQLKKSETELWCNSWNSFSSRAAVVFMWIK